jgi:hypothetical protein
MFKYPQRGHFKPADIEERSRYVPVNQRLDFKTKPNKAISKPLSPLDSHHPTKRTQWEAVILLKTVQASHNQPTLQGSHEGALSG